MGIERAITGRNELGGRSSLQITSDGRALGDVYIQDQTTRPLSVRMIDTLDTLTLDSSPVVDSYDIELTAGHGVVAGDNIAIVENNGGPLLYWGEVMSVATNTITLDTPIPYGFSTSANLLKYDPNLNVDGSITKQASSLYNYFDAAVDITRFLIHITDGTAMDDGTFGGIAELTRGVVLRKKSGSTYTNYWNVKDNGGFGELAYDKQYDAKAPSGIYGLTVRLTYAGASKHGVTIRLQPGEEIQLLIQDDLTALTKFTVMVEGHIVD